MKGIHVGYQINPAPDVFGYSVFDKDWAGLPTSGCREAMMA